MAYQSRMFPPGFIAPSSRTTVVLSNSPSCQKCGLVQSISINPFITFASMSSVRTSPYKRRPRRSKWRIYLRNHCLLMHLSSTVNQLWGGDTHEADGRECSNCYKIKFVRAVACAPSFTCAPHETIRALQPRPRETLS